MKKPKKTIKVKAFAIVRNGKIPEWTSRGSGLSIISNPNWAKAHIKEYCEYGVIVPCTITYQTH